MNKNEEHSQIAPLVRQVEEARAQLSHDIEALVHKVSLDNLKHEALESVKDVAGDVKTSIVYLSVQTKELLQRYWLPATLAVGAGGLVRASTASRQKSMLFAGAVVCGLVAVASAYRLFRRRSPRALQAPYLSPPTQR